MTTFTLYGSWNQLLGQWLTDKCRTRRTNLIWLIVGLYLCGKVQTSAIVKRWPLMARTSSLTRRLSRFLDNGAVRPAVWYRPVARQLLAGWEGQTITLIIDATKVGAGHQLIMVALGYRKRALPLAWTWVPYTRGHVTVEVQLTLLKRVQALVPAGVTVILAGDSGFGSVKLMQQAREWGWHYVLRQRAQHLVQAAGGTEWIRFDQLATRPGECVWWPNARYTRQWKSTTHLLAYWLVGDDKAWLLTTDLPDARTARQAYARRMWIEEMFGDWKGHGWDLETTHLRHPDRLSRLTLAICLLYVWLTWYGERIIKTGRRAWVDRHDRRDLSLVRIGLDTLQRCLTLAIQPPVPFPSLVGGPSVR
jgi:hypothetical protein